MRREPKVFCVYSLTCDKDGSIYYGCTKRPEARKNAHRTKPTNRLVAAKWKEHGRDSMVFKIIKNQMGMTEAHRLEGNLIEQNLGTPRCLNLRGYVVACGLESSKSSERLCAWRCKMRCEKSWVVARKKIEAEYGRPLTREQYHQLERGLTTPRIKMREAVYRATKGYVKVNEWVPQIKERAKL